MSETRNEISGTVFGPVLQVGRIDTFHLIQAAAPVTPASLPVDGGFVGRAPELGVPADFLAPGGDRTALAVVGLAGVGKSALVVRAAHLAAEAGRFPGGVLFVDAQGYNDDRRLDATDALAALLRALGVPGEAVPAGQGEREALYRSQLAARPSVLVVVDNASSADQVLPLRPAGRAHRLVLTSRDNLPVPRARRIELDVLPAPEAVAVLEDALRSVDPADDRITADPAAAAVLAESCGHLPLALRILAEVVADRPGEELSRFAASIAAAHDRLGELAYDDSVDVRTAFNASYARLPAAQARMFRLIALHPGRTVSVAAAAAALTGAEPAEASELLVRLRRAHLVQAGVVADSYRFHDLLRIYAAEQCARVEAEVARRAAERALVGHYVAHVKAVRDHLDPTLVDGDLFPDRLTALAWFDGEVHNLLPVLELAARNGWHGEVLEGGQAAYRYFNPRRSAEWVPVDELAPASARELGDRIGEGRVLNGLGSAYHRVRRFEEALARFQSALALFRDAGSVRDQAHSLNNIASTCALIGWTAEAVRYMGESATAYREAGDADGEARCLANLGKINSDLGEHGRAVPSLERGAGTAPGDRGSGRRGGLPQRVGHRAQRAGRHRGGRALPPRRAGGVPGDRQPARRGAGTGQPRRDRAREGRPHPVVDLPPAGLEISREVGDAHGEGIADYNLGLTYWSLGRRREAVDHLRRAVEQLNAVNDPRMAGEARRSIDLIEREGLGRRWFTGWRRGR